MPVLFVFSSDMGTDPNDIVLKGTLKSDDNALHVDSTTTSNVQMGLSFADGIKLTGNGTTTTIDTISGDFRNPSDILDERKFQTNGGGSRTETKKIAAEALNGSISNTITTTNVLENFGATLSLAAMQEEQVVTPGWLLLPSVKGTGKLTTDDGGSSIHTRGLATVSNWDTNNKYVNTFLTDGSRTSQFTPTGSGWSVATVTTNGGINFAKTNEFTNTVSGELTETDTRTLTNATLLPGYTGASLFSISLTTTDDYSKTLSSAAPDNDPLDLGFSDTNNYHSYNYRGDKIDTRFQFALTLPPTASNSTTHPAPVSNWPKILDLFGNRPSGIVFFNRQLPH